MKLVKQMCILAFAASLMFSACTKEKSLVNQNLNATPAKTSGKKGLVASSYSTTPYEVTACTTQVATLWAGQNMDAGTVTVSNTEDSVYVTYATSGTWKLEDIHLYIGPLSGVPLAGNGNPQNGNFATATTFSTAVNSATYVFPASALPTSFVVAAHCVVSQYGNCRRSNTQTGWGAGTAFSGNNWATYIEFTKGSCAGSGSGGNGGGSGGSGQGGGDN